MRPAEFCRGLLRVLEASEGRRRRRRRDTTADVIGLGIKRNLLERAVTDDPEPDAFEGWLVEQCLAAADTVSVGAARAIALDVFGEWRLAARNPEFAAWLAHGAPADEDGGPEMAPIPPTARDAPA